MISDYRTGISGAVRSLAERLQTLPTIGETPVERTGLSIGLGQVELGLDARLRLCSL